jgi:hypothetical protein
MDAEVWPSSSLHGSQDPEHVTGGFLKYGGYKDEGSCGRVEYVRVFNAGGGTSEASALGFFACGHGTRVAHVEVAHSQGNGVALAGGMTMLKYVTVYNALKVGVNVSNGYRGGIQFLHVDVPTNGTSAFTSQGVWASFPASLDKTSFRTHPMVYGATFIAGDIVNKTHAGAGRGIPLPIVDVALGSGLTMANSIVMSVSSRPFGIRVADCSPVMDVSHFHGELDNAEQWFSNDRIDVSQHNVVAGFGPFPRNALGVPQKPTTMADQKNLTWKPYHLGSGCNGTLNLADTSLPQFYAFESMSSLGEEAMAENTFDPRPTVALQASSYADPVPFDVVKGMAATKNADVVWKLRRHFTRRAANATIPGAFAPSNSSSSIWYAPWSELSNSLPKLEDAGRLYARLTTFHPDSTDCSRVVANMMIQQGHCYKAGRCTLTPPDPQLKGAWYPGGFKPLPLNINPGFKMSLSNATCAATTRLLPAWRKLTAGKLESLKVIGSNWSW